MESIKTAIGYLIESIGKKLNSPAEQNQYRYLTSCMLAVGLSVPEMVPEQEVRGLFVWTTLTFGRWE